MTVAPRPGLCPEATNGCGTTLRSGPVAEGTRQEDKMLLHAARKVVVLVVGGTVLILGIIMLVTPGPGIAGVIAGLAILATEFVWAKVLLKRMKDRAATLAGQAGLCRQPSACVSTTVEQGQHRGRTDTRDLGDLNSMGALP